MAFCVIVLLPRLGGPHLHLCLDGSAPAVALHMSDGNDSDLIFGGDDSHQDQKVDVANPVLGKLLAALPRCGIVPDRSALLCYGMSALSAPGAAHDSSAGVPPVPAAPASRSSHLVSPRFVAIVGLHSRAAHEPGDHHVSDSSTHTQCVPADCRAVTARCPCGGRLIAAPVPFLTLGQAIERALAANPALQGFAFSLKAQEARIAQADQRPVTEASFELENVLGSGDVSGGWTRLKRPLPCRR